MSGGKDGYQIIREPSFQIIINHHDQQQERLSVTGYKTQTAKSVLFHIFGGLFLGFPYLFVHWYPQYKVIKYSKCDLKECDVVLIKDSVDTFSVKSIYTVILSPGASLTFRKSLSSSLNVSCVNRCFVHNHTKYVWSEETGQFSQLHGWDSGTKYVKELLEESIGYSEEEQQLLLELYGKNEIVVEVKSYWKLFLLEVLHPFYLFQLFSVLLWSVDDYVYYAVCVVIITAISIVLSLYTTKQQSKSLSNLVEKSVVQSVMVVRNDGTREEIESEYLVPGDVIEIPVHGCTMPCDAVLLDGQCIVNESTLTGESAPATKTPPPCTNEPFDSIILKRHTLFGGTEVIQTRFYGESKVRAVVINTGYSTAKGELVRTILHPKPIGFKFYEDSIKFVCFLFCLAAVGMTYLMCIYISRGMDVESMVLDALDLITIVVPPALPAAMTTGIVYSQARLLKKDIFCISPPRINICGKLKLFCFDKTGTLTEEGLDVYAVIPARDAVFAERNHEPSTLSVRDPLQVAMATCHCLTWIEGRLSGDALDTSMFESVLWDLEEPRKDTNMYDSLAPSVVRPQTREAQAQGSAVDDLLDLAEESQLPYEIGIVREHPFTSVSQCMSVITRCLGEDHMNLYCKGAPEKIVDLCLEHTLPENFNTQLEAFTSTGFRVIALAYKEFEPKFNWRKAQRAKREEVENNLVFLGLLVMQNTLKTNTVGVIRDLRGANIRCVMVTGDNLLTSVSVARDCSMVLPDDVIVRVQATPPDRPGALPLLKFEPIGLPDSMPNDDTRKNFHYALDGRTWSLLRSSYSELIPRLLVKGTIFARMLPEQKTQLVEAFQELEYVVGMCGDGANDCGAMKAAHIGVSLSEAESSVAAPFTSKTQDISCVVSLVKEGRCALVTSFVIFKYMAMYSLIQFSSVLVLYTEGVSLSNMEFLYVDLCITTSLAIVIGRNGPASTLSRNQPIASLVSAANILPLLLQIVLTIGIQLAALRYLYLQDWFQPVNASTDEVTTCWENTVVYSVSSFQFLILALVYSKGKPHRQAFYKDVWFALTLSSLCAFTVLLTVYPVGPLAEFFEVVPYSDGPPAARWFRWTLLTFPAVNLLVSFLIEIAFSNTKWLKNVIHVLKRKYGPKHKYKQVLLEPVLEFGLVTTTQC